MVAQIDYLLPDTPDSGELVSGLIWGVIKEESENQVALAIAGGATAEQAAQTYGLRVFYERWTPWDIWTNQQEGQFRAPVVNVWRESENLNERSSNQMSRQTYDGSWNVDVYGCGRARENPDTPGEQIAADADAIAQRDRGLRWVRRYLAAAKNIYLRQPKPGGFIVNTSVRSFDYFVPTVDGHPVPRVKAARLVFDASYNEFSPQATEETLEAVEIDMYTLDPATLEVRLAAEVDIEYPLP